MMNLASVYQQAGQDAKAVEMFERMRAAGLLTESARLRHGLAPAGQHQRPREGRDGADRRGPVEGHPGPERRRSTSYQGQSYYDDDNTDKAIDAWTKGAPMAKTGEMYLNLAKLQVDKDRYAEAKAAARSALDKGVKKPGRSLAGDRPEPRKGWATRPAATAAYREAAKYPETKKWAEAELRQASGK